MPKTSYPFPDRNPKGEFLPCAAAYDRRGVTIHDKVKEIVERVQGSDEARRARLQYMTIEEELERAYRYVAPCQANANVFSFKFAEVIRSAANAYEVLCKRLYARLYNGNDHINIFNYLALDLWLRLAERRVTHLLAVDSFADFPEVRRPFVNLATWDKASPVREEHIPGWWNACNAVKHEDAGFEKSATLAQATAALAALFVLTETAYAGGILVGGCVPYLVADWNALRSGQQDLIIQLGDEFPIDSPRWARLFGHDGPAPPLYLLKNVPTLASAAGEPPESH